MSNRRLLLSLNNNGLSDTHLWKDVDRIWFSQRGIFSVVFTFDINDNVSLIHDNNAVFGNTDDKILKWDSITMAVGLCSTSDIDSCVKYSYAKWEPHAKDNEIGFYVSSGMSSGSTNNKHYVGGYPGWPSLMYFNYIDNKYFCLVFCADGSNSMITTLTPIFINVPKVEAHGRIYHLAYDAITKKCYYIDEYDNINGVPNVDLEYKNNEFYVN